MTENREKRRVLRAPADPNGAREGGSRAPMAVRSYVMSRRKRTRWLNDNMADSRRVYALPTSGTSEKRTHEARPGMRKKAFRWLITVVCVLGLALSVPLIRLVISQFTVKDISGGAGKYSTEELAAAAGIRIGDPLPGAASAKNERRVLEALPYLKDCKIKSDLHGNVVFTVAEHTPAAYFGLGERYFAITADLQVVESRTDPAAYIEAGLVRAEISGISVALVGQKLQIGSADPAFITEFLTAATESGDFDRFSFLRFDNPFSIESVSRSGDTVRYGSADNIASKLQIARTLQADGAQEPDTVCIVDVSEPKAAFVRTEAAPAPAEPAAEAGS